MCVVWCMADLQRIQEKLFQMRLFTRIKFIVVFFLAFVFLFFGCKSYDEQKKELADTPLRGTIHVSADESFKPIVDALVQVYDSNYPNAHIIVDYKPEAECLKDLLVDSVRMVIATRGYSNEEENLIVDSFK